MLFDWWLRVPSEGYHRFPYQKNITDFIPKDFGLKIDGEQGFTWQLAGKKTRNNSELIPGFQSAKIHTFSRKQPTHIFYMIFRTIVQYPIHISFFLSSIHILRHFGSRAHRLCLLIGVCSYHHGIWEQAAGPYSKERNAKCIIWWWSQVQDACWLRKAFARGEKFLA